MSKKSSRLFTAVLIALVMVASVFAMFALTACDGADKQPNPSGDTEYYVSFDMQTHGVQITEIQTSGGKATKPADPVAKGYTFGGWFTDKQCTQGKEFDFNSTVTSDITLYAKWTEAAPEPATSTDYYLVVGTAGNYSVATNVVLTEKDGAYTLKVSGKSIAATTQEIPNAGTAYNFKDALGAGKDLDGIIMSMGGMLQGYGQSGGVDFIFIKGKTLDGVQVPNGYALEYGAPIAANDYYLVVGTAGNYSVAQNVVLTEKDGAYTLKVSGQNVAATTQEIPNAGTAYNFKDALGAGKDLDGIIMSMGGMLQGYGQSGGVDIIFVKGTTLDGIQIPQGYALEYTAPVIANDYYLVVGTAGNYSVAQNVVLTEKDGAYTLKVSGKSIAATTQEIPNAGTAYNFKDALGEGKDLDGIIMSMGGTLQGYGQSGGVDFIFVKGTTLDGIQIPQGYALEYTAPEA